ncbi:SPFH domain-containing protein [Halospeciosus flavus]|uniref:SPFH domain-containing protein n=1 Tax=Halospeciosus flavus TaxID=3032283 RepID=A0ABD5Z775_9EURY|nr:SPFH domain-containing protein [Halospeciosus flavus]
MDSTGRRLFRELGRASTSVGTRSDGRSQSEAAAGDTTGFGTLHWLFVALLVVAVALAVFVSVWYAVGVLLLALAIVTVASSVQIVQAYERRPYTVFGAFRGMLGPGLRFVPPFVSKSYVYDVRTRTLDVPTQEAITEDNSPVRANAVVYIRVVNAERAFLEVEDYETAVLNLAQTTLRAVIGDMELDETLSRRTEINRRIHEELDEPTDAWGIRVEGVEVREVMPSDVVKSAMERQASAERTRRAMILEAQGERQSAIERARGEKQAAIVRAQGSKQAQVLEAQGDAVATVLRARAAEAMGERAVIERGMESLERIGQSPSTTFVLPQELTSLLGRYGKHLSGSDVGGGGAGGGGLRSRDFDAETVEWLGLDEIDDLVSEVVDDERSEVEIEVEEP